MVFGVVFKYICWKIQWIIPINNMNQPFLIRLILLFLLLISLAVSQLNLDLEKTQAVLYSNNEVVLKFKCTGGNGIYTFKFFSIPKGWRTNKNDLIIPQFQVGVNQQWNFDVQVTDSDENYLTQTIKVVFSGFKVQIHPVTLPMTGNKKIVEEEEVTEEQDFNFGELISQYPGLEARNQSLFGIDFDNLLDITPHLIASANAVYDPKRDGRKISDFQVKRNAALQRQINADKAIANLLNIIQKLTANVNAAQQEKIKYDNQLRQANLDSRKCRDQLFKLEDTRAKITNAVMDRKTKIDQFEVQLQNNQNIKEQIKAALNNLVSQRLEIERFSIPFNINLERLQAQLDECDVSLNQEKGQIEETFAQINQNKAEIDIIQTEIQSSEKRVSELTTDLGLVRKKISSLKEELLMAEQEEQQIIEDRAYFERIPQEGKVKVQSLSQRIIRLQDKIQKINGQIRENINQCKGFSEEAKEIREQLSLSQFNYNEIGRLIEEQRVKLNSIEQNIQSLKQNSAKLPVELVTLQKQLEKYQMRIKRQKYICGVADEEVLKARANVDAVVEKFNQNSEFLEKANSNLEKARAEKELADLAIEQVLSTTTDVNPFALIPKGATPFPYFGSTPSAQQPQQQKVQEKVEVQKPKQVEEVKEKPSEPTGLTIEKQLNDNFKIGQAKDYQQPISVGSLSSFLKYNMNIRAKPEDARKEILFPIDQDSRGKVVSPASKTAGLSFFSCGNGSSRGLYGKIESVELGVLVVISNNKKYTISLSVCTKIASTSPSNFFEKGASVYFKGRTIFSFRTTTLFNGDEIIITPQE